MVKFMQELTFNQIEMVSGELSAGACMSLSVLTGTLVGAGGVIAAGFFTDGIAWGFVRVGAGAGAAGGAIIGDMICY